MHWLIGEGAEWVQRRKTGVAGGPKTKAGIRSTTVGTGKYELAEKSTE